MLTLDARTLISDDASQTEDLKHSVNSIQSTSSSSNVSLSDRLPGLRSPNGSSKDPEDDRSSALSSISASSALSSVSAGSSEQERARRRKRVDSIHNTKARGARSPSPSSSEASDVEESEDEDAHGNLKKGHKKYLTSGLYSRTLKEDDAPTSQESPAPEAAESSRSTPFEVEIHTANPTPEPETEAEAAETATSTEAPPQPARAGSQRASSLAAQNRFARNGRGVRPPPRSKAPALPKKPKKVRQPKTTDAQALTLPPHFEGPLLPLPVEWGQVVLEEKREYKLAHHIHRDFRPCGLGRQRVLRQAGKYMQPTKYMTIKQNLYPERFKLKSEEPAICQCPKGSTCDEDCINRLMQYLCSPKLCPAGPTCTNGPFNERDPFRRPDGRSATKVFYTGNRGFGLKAVVDIPRDTFIMEYRGEVISKEESYKRVMNEYEGRQDFYFLDYDGDEIIDAGMKGNKARFCNHSCSPNCKMIRYRLADYDEWQIGLYAAVDIKAGTELVYDYGWVTFASMNESTSQTETPQQPQLDTRSKEAEAASSKTYEQRCHCGAADCVGVLGAKKKKPSKKGDPKKAVSKRPKSAPAPKRKKPAKSAMQADQSSADSDDEVLEQVLPIKKKQRHC